MTTRMIVPSVLSSYPGAVYLDYIDYKRVKFLTGDKLVTSITEENFDLETGRPLNNLSQNTAVDSFFIDALADNLAESKNIGLKLIYDYPKMLETDEMRDMKIVGECSIDAVFITEGASMKNLFGYYMYVIDETGNKKLLGDSEDVGDYHYEPTVIFPHVYSDEKNPNSLQQGETRRLRGNLPNGNFKDVYVGLFLIPHAWYAFQEKGEVYNNLILYSTLDFNDAFSTSDYQFLNDKIYSVYFKSRSSTGHELLLLGFEDLVDGDYNTDLDYNDCVVGFDVSDVKAVENWDSYETVQVTPKGDVKYNNIMNIDDDGEYVLFKDHAIIPDNYIFERHMCFDSEARRDAVYKAYDDLLTNYQKGIYKETDEDGKYKCVIKHLFRRNDMINAIDKTTGHKKIYLNQCRHNKGSKSAALKTYANILKENLHDPSYQEKYKLCREENEKTELIRLTDASDPPKRESNIPSIRITGSGIVDCINGKTSISSKNRAAYQVYADVDTDGGLCVNIGMNTHPDGVFMEGKKNFVRYVGFNVDNVYKMVVDLKDLAIYYENPSTGALTSMTPSFPSDKIRISDIVYTADGIKDLISVFRSDSKAFYRIVTVNDTMSFYCIRLPDVKNNPTMIFVDDDSDFSWDNGDKAQTGIFFNKRSSSTVPRLTSFYTYTRKHDD